LIAGVSLITSIQRETLRRFVTFAAFGSLGTIIDMGAFTALWFSGINNPYAARALSFTISVAAMWYVHRSITFKTRGRPGALWELQKFFVSNVIAFLPSLAVFMVSIEGSAFLAAFPIIAVGCGALVGLAVNFALSHLWTFR
jgi:putative flippase GtrA